MGKERFSTKQIAFTAMFAALILMATYVIKIPTPVIGYIHVGDCFVLLAGIFLGPVPGALAAGIGSGLADLLGGFPVWAPGTFAIKFVTALVAAGIYRVIQSRGKHGFVQEDESVGQHEMDRGNRSYEQVDLSVGQSEKDGGNHRSAQGELSGGQLKIGKRNHKSSAVILAGIPAEVIMVAGYFFYNVLILSLANQGLNGTSLASALTASAAEIPFNVIQGAAGVVLAVLLRPLCSKLKR